MSWLVLVFHRHSQFIVGFALVGFAFVGFVLVGFALVGFV